MCLIYSVLEVEQKSTKHGLATGVTIGGDSTKNGMNTLIMCIRLSQIIGLIKLTNQNQLIKVNSYRIRTNIVQDYWGMWLMLHMRSIYYWYNNVDLLGVVHCQPPIQILESEVQSEWRYSLFNHAHFWPAETITDVLDLLVPESNQFLKNF